MATAVLRPHDCLKDRFRGSTMTCSSDSRSRRNRPRSARRRRSPSKSHGIEVGTQPVPAKAPSAGLVMEKVYILKRGEALTSVDVLLQKEKNEKGDHQNLPPRTTGMSGSQPDVVHVSLPVVRVHDSSEKASSPYAGTAFESSPSPRSLPFPAFFRKPEPVLDDLATKDIRRLLQLQI